MFMDRVSTNLNKWEGEERRRDSQGCLHRTANSGVGTELKGNCLAAAWSFPTMCLP